MFATNRNGTMRQAPSGTVQSFADQEVQRTLSHIKEELKNQTISTQYSATSEEGAETP